MNKYPEIFLPDEAHCIIHGAVGALEIMTLNVDAPKGVAVICHPHPLHHGTMNNKVVHTLSRAFQRKGYASVRFNYRGVGHSEGEFGHSVGEVEDLTAVIKWVDSVCHKPKLILAGFSFGAFIAAMGATKHSCQQLVSIAPAVTHQPYDDLKVTCPWIVIQGERDEVIAPEVVYSWFAQHQSNPQLKLIKMPDASHFFHGKLILLRTLIEENLIDF